MKLTIPVAPRTKKTHNRTVDIGKRCGACRRGPRTIVLPSENYEEFEAAVAPALQRVMLAREPRREQCPRCDGTGRRGSKSCGGCLATGMRAVPLIAGVVVEAVFYRDRNIGDLCGYQQALGDVLEAGGVIENDRQILCWPQPADGGWPLRKDAAQPRIEVVITEVAVAGETLEMGLA